MYFNHITQLYIHALLSQVDDLGICVDDLLCSTCVEVVLFKAESINHKKILPHVHICCRSSWSCLQ